MHTILNQMPEAVILVRSDKILFTNRVFEKLIDIFKKTLTEKQKEKEFDWVNTAFFEVHDE